MIGGETGRGKGYFIKPSVFDLAFCYLENCGTRH